MNWCFRIHSARAFKRKSMRPHQLVKILHNAYGVTLQLGVRGFKAKAPELIAPAWHFLSVCELSLTPSKMSQRGDPRRTCEWATHERKLIYFAPPNSLSRGWYTWIMQNLSSLRLIKWRVIDFGHSLGALQGVAETPANGIKPVLLVCRSKVLPLFASAHYTCFQYLFLPPLVNVKPCAVEHALFWIGARKAAQ